MRKQVVVGFISLLLVCTCFAQAEENLLFLLDKRPEVRDGNTSYLAVFVKYNELGDYADVITYRRITVPVTRSQYDNLVKEHKYTLKQLVFLNIELPAETEEFLKKEAEQNPFNNPVTQSYDKYKQETGLKQLLAEAAYLKGTAVHMASTGEPVLYEDITSLNEKALELADAKESFAKEYKIPEDTLDRTYPDFRLIEEFIEVYNKTYMKPGIGYYDNENQDLKKFFEKVSGHEVKGVENYRNWKYRILGMVIFGLIGVFGGIGVGSLSERHSTAKGLITSIILLSLVIWLIGWVIK